MRVAFWGVLAGANLYTAVTGLAAGSYGWALLGASMTLWCLYQGGRRAQA